MRTAAVLPVKRFSFAKQRLGVSIADSLRRQLVRAMVSDVLLALATVNEIDLKIVVTCEPVAAAAASSEGALVIEDSEQGQSAAVQLGIQAAIAKGAQRVLCIPGDCPTLDPAELSSLLRDGAQNGKAEVVIVPDRHGTGTNGLLLCPPEAIAPSFGPGSCARHRDLARAAQVQSRLAHPASLLLDIDTGEDLQALRQRLANGRIHATQTRAVLDTIDEQTWAASHSAA